MFIDKALQLASAQADVRVAGTYYSTNCIDLGSAKGKNIACTRGYIQVRVGTAFAGGTSVQFDIVGSDTPWTAAAGTGGTNWKQFGESSGAIAEASLTANTIVFEVPVPDNMDKRYLGVRMVGVGIHTAGDVDINIGSNRTTGPV